MIAIIFIIFSKSQQIEDANTKKMEYMFKKTKNKFLFDTLRKYKTQNTSIIK